MASSSRIFKVLAVTYLHMLRTWRYRVSYLNSSINMMLWNLIFLLGALLFIPSNKLATVAPQLFWAVSAWDIMSYTVFNIAGWTIWFAVTTGLVEEHMLHDTRLSLFFAGRLVTVAMESAIAVPLVYLMLRLIIHKPFPLAVHPLYITLGLVELTLMALGYALILSAIGLLLRIPGTMLDISNFIAFLLGGIATPIKTIPAQLRPITLAIPYSHAAEVLRYGASELEPYLGLHMELVLSAVLTLAMVLLGFAVQEYVERHTLRVHGVKGVGRM
jgi:ABC-type polysaccharide/polyol phosphate export permease